MASTLTLWTAIFLGPIPEKLRNSLFSIICYNIAFQNKISSNYHTIISTYLIYLYFLQQNLGGSIVLNP